MRPSARTAAAVFRRSTHRHDAGDLPSSIDPGASGAGLPRFRGKRCGAPSIQTNSHSNQPAATWIRSKGGDLDSEPRLPFHALPDSVGHGVFDDEGARTLSVQ
jgi:hypothetical protein